MTSGPDSADKRTHIERINDFDNPAAGVDVGEFAPANQARERPKPKE
jgi:hypothetical protein